MLNGCYAIRSILSIRLIHLLDLTHLTLLHLEFSARPRTGTRRYGGKSCIPKFMKPLFIIIALMRTCWR